MQEKEPKVNDIVYAMALMGLVILCFVGSFLLYLFGPTNLSESRKIMVLIPVNTPLLEAAKILEQRGVIENHRFFVLWSKILGYDKKIRYGEHSLKAGEAPIAILRELARGGSTYIPLVIPPGFSIYDIARLLEEKGIASRESFLSIVKNRDIATAHGFDANTLEGLLFPDTYFVTKATDPLTLVNTMVKNFHRHISPLKAEIEAKGISLKDLITLASMVEKEAADPEERPLIASVFWNRIRLGMKLQSDPTAIYGEERAKGPVTKADLANNTPYNTYLISGLPPGPICNPGMDSILAVLRPSPSEYLYFVSKEDGTHSFSRTYSEHLGAIKKYQKAKRSNKP